MATQEARVLDAQDVHEEALRGVEEERSEGNEGGLEGPEVGQLYCQEG
jgi:hypothetical protein